MELQTVQLIKKDKMKELQKGCRKVLQTVARIHLEHCLVRLKVCLFLSWNIRDIGVSEMY